jgi:hypothetical protein
MAIGFWNKVKKFFQKIGNGIKTVVGKIVGVGRKVAETVATPVKTLMNLNPTLKKLSPFVDSVTNIYRTSEDLMLNKGNNLRDNMRRFIPNSNG